MTKNFKDYQEDAYSEEDQEYKFKKRDKKRYDVKKRAVQRARKNKRNMKNAWYDT